MTFTRILIIILLGIITLPQTLVGLITTLCVKKKRIQVLRIFHNDKPGLPFILVVTEKLNGVSLGVFVLINKEYIDRSDMNTIKHEYGHLIQGLITNWFYLIFIGIKSLYNNRQSLKNPKYQGKEYFKHYPENWADYLGGVVR